MPENCYQLGRNNIPNIVFDMILSHSKFGQYQIAQKINDTLQIPLISLEHTLPIPQWPQETLSQFLSMKGDYNIFITNYSKGKWGMDGDVIEHSVDTNLFKPDDNVDRSKILTVAHDFIKRDYALNYQGWERITKGFGQSSCRGNRRSFLVKVNLWKI